jgi:molybdenum cofactor guanylyltransferase
MMTPIDHVSASELSHSEPSRSEPPLFGLLLCGGRSSRMGQDKALLQLGVESLLQRGLRLLRESGCGGVWLSGDYPGFASIPDHPAWADRGPLAGIASALQRYPEARWLILPVDMPGMEPGPLRALVTQASTHPVGMGVEQSQFPLLLQPGALPVLVKLLTSGERRDCSVHALLHQLALPLIAADRLLPDAASESLARTLCNTNTPEEWQQFQASAHSTPSELIFSDPLLSVAVDTEALSSPHHSTRTPI